MNREGMKKGSIMNRNYIASELVQAAREMAAGKLWKVGDGWQSDSGLADGYGVESYVLFAVNDMLKKHGLNQIADIDASNSPEIKKTIGLPRKWDERQIEKVLDDMTDINYHSERKNVENALASRVEEAPRRSSVNASKELFSLAQHLNEANEIFAKLLNKHIYDDIVGQFGKNGAKTRAELQEAWNKVTSATMDVRTVTRNAR